MAKRSNSIRVALVTELLWYPRGTERVVDAICEIFPNADVYALFGNPNDLKQLKYLSCRNIIFSWLNRLPFVKYYYRYTLFLWPILIEEFRFDNYDLVISLSSSVAKGIVVPRDTIHISYFNTPMRYIWDLQSTYFNRKNSTLLKLIIIRGFNHYLRIWDSIRNNSIDYLITNSKYIKRRVEKFYNIKVNEVIYPFFNNEFVDKYINNKQTKESENSYYLYHGPLEINKGILTCIDCAIKYKIPLKITGIGNLKNEVLRRIKGHSNIQYLGWVEEEEKFKIMSKARALLYPSNEDFGIVPMEALSVGTPVIVLRDSGVSEIVEDGKNGIIIEKQDPEALKMGVDNIENINWDTNYLINSVKKYNRSNYISKIKSVIELTLNP